MARVLNVLLTHQEQSELTPLLEVWNTVAQEHSLLLAYGGSADGYRKIVHQPRLFLDDPRLRTRDHQREYQSITSLFKAVQQWIRSSRDPCDYVHITEYDHIPLRADLNVRQVERMVAENADMIGFHLHRIDGTSHPHYLYHASNEQFHPWLAAFSIRPDSSTTLSMLGTGSVWTREAFETISALDEPFPIYFEIYLPTLAHHLGFRVRDWGEQNAFVSNLGDKTSEIDLARAQGAWSLHPVKCIPPGIRTSLHA